MSRSSLRALVLALATIMCCALVAGPAQAASKAERKQNSSIKKNRSGVKKNRSSVKRAASDAKKARAAAKKVDTKAIAALAAAVKAALDAGKAQQGVNAINTNVVPAALKGLTDLQNGLLALKAGLESAGAGLTKLAAFTAADEYGVVQIAEGASSTPIPGCFYETGNVPDNVQDAIVSGTCLVPSTVAPGTEVHILAGIRSNESDGVAGGPAAGVAGIVAYGQTGTATAGPTAGALVALGGGATTPTGAGQPPAVAIPLKSAPTSTTETGFPFQPISSDKFVDLATTQFTGTPATPLFGNAAGRSITFTVRFNDLTPDANDPTA